MRPYARYVLDRIMVLTALTVMLTGCVAVPSPQISAELTALKVIVTLTRAGTTDPMQVLALNSVEIRQADRINVDEGGRARLEFPDNVVVELFRSTGMLMLSDPQIVPTGSPFLQMKLEYGTAKLNLPDIAKTRISVETDYATIRAVTPDADFVLCHNEVNSCAVVFRGELEVEAQGQVRTIHSGEGTYVFPGQPPSPPLCGDMQALNQWLDLKRSTGPAEGLGAVVARWSSCFPELGATTPSAITSTVTITVASETSTLSATTCPGTYLLNPADGAEYVHIPGGEFAMGADAASAISRLEQPLHAANVASFWIQCMEVTNEQYARCVAAGVCSPPTNNDWNKPERVSYPVTHVTWNQATDYARWVGGRLPTEAEWEKTCRGADGRTYPWGSESPTAELANFGDTPGESTPVGSYPAGASPYGVLDMGGNVWEWTSSLEQPYPYRADDGREDPAAEGVRVARGGSFYYTKYQVTCAARSGFSPDTVSEYFGFRVVFSP